MTTFENIVICEISSESRNFEQIEKFHFSDLLVIEEVIKKFSQQILNPIDPQIKYRRNRKIQKTEYHNLGLSNIDVHDSEEVLSPNFGQKT